MTTLTAPAQAARFRRPATAPVFTGIGVIAPNGGDTESYWRHCLAGVSGIGTIQRFDTSTYPISVAGEVDDFDPAVGVPRRLRPQTDRWTQLALAATTAALADAGVDPADLDPYSMSVITASSSGGNEFGQREIGRLWSSGPDYVSAYQSIAWFYAATTGQIGIHQGIKGSCGVVVAEQAGGLDALAQAARELRHGGRLAITGGTEAPLSPYALTCQIASGLLSSATEPSLAYLPFDRSARGYVPGEGGAILIMEEPEAARQRDATVYGVLAGHAATFDPRPGLGRGSTRQRAITQALNSAGVRPEQIDVVFADGAGIAALDRDEAAAITAVFGPYGVPVTVPKSTVGRLYAGGAALDTATALLSLRDQVIAPTITTTDVDPAYQLDLVLGVARPAKLQTALVLAHGHGGFNSAVVLQNVANSVQTGHTPGTDKERGNDR